MTGAVGRVVRRSLPASASEVLSQCSCGASVVVRLSADSKTSPAGVWTEKGATAVYANAIATTAGPREVGGSCPGFTESCRSCYGKSLERYTAFERLAADNLATLRHVEECGGARALTRVFVDILDHVAEHQRRDGLEVATFRWNMSGDVWSEKVARAIASAHRARPQVEGWLYTRTLSAVRHLVRGGDGLRVYVSVDRHNVTRAMRVAHRWNVPVAVLADDQSEARAILAVGGTVEVLRARLCPASGKWANDGRGPAHVVGLDGRRSSLEFGGSVRGACDACRLCLPSGLGSSVVFLRRGGSRDLFANVPVAIGAKS
jgi:hypothetical protein